MVAGTKDAGTLPVLTANTTLQTGTFFGGSNNANELNLDPGPSEGFVVSLCTYERGDSLASCLVRLKNINMMST